MYKKNNTQWHIQCVMSNRGHPPHYTITRFSEELGHYVNHARFNEYEAARLALTEMEEA